MGGSSSKKVTAENIKNQGSQGQLEDRADDLMSVKSGITISSDKSKSKLSQSRLSLKTTRKSLVMGGQAGEEARKKLLQIPQGHLRRISAKNSVMKDNVVLDKDFSVVGSNDECCRQDDVEFLSFKDDLPSILDSPPTMRNSIIVQKLYICALVYPWHKPKECKEQKIIQMKTIKEILDYVTSPPIGTPDFYTDVIFANLINCLERHTLRRTVGPENRSEMSGASSIRFTPDQINNAKDLPSSQTDYSDPSFGYTKYVYELLLKYVAAMKVSDSKHFIDEYFCTAVLAKLDTSDARERAVLKSLCLKIYIKFTEHRKLLRNCMNYEFSRFSYESGRHKGITELLEILEPIVKGFKAPLKKDHLETLGKAIFPLHSASYTVLQDYHDELRKLVMIFMDKESKVIGPIVVKKISHYWPHRDGPKQVLLITELEEILEHIEMHQWELEEFHTARDELFLLLGKIINSENYQVCQRALKLWSNDFLTGGCLHYQRFGPQFLEHAFEPMYFKSHDHWQNNSNLASDKVDDDDEKRGKGGKGKEKGSSKKEIGNCRVGQIALNILYNYKRCNYDIYEERKKKYLEKRNGVREEQQHNNYFIQDDRWEEVERQAKAFRDSISRQ